MGNMTMADQPWNKPKTEPGNSSKTRKFRVGQKVRHNERGVGTVKFLYHTAPNAQFPYGVNFENDPHWTFRVLEDELREVK